LKFFRELRFFFSCIITSMRSLVWVLVVLMLMFYVFGLSLCQGTVDFLDGDEWDSSTHEKLRHHFADLGSSLLTLYEAMAGGISWGELIDALSPLSWHYSAIFLCFTSLTILAVLNIVTGVFVQTALERAQSDRDTLIQEVITHKDNYLQKIGHIFREVDVDGSGSITLQEFRDAMEDDRMEAYLDALGIRIEDVDVLFHLLDRDGGGYIDVVEFLGGCLKMRGDAKGLDIAIVQFQAKWLMYNMGQLVGCLSRCEALKDGFESEVSPCLSDRCSSNLKAAAMQHVRNIQMLPVLQEAVRPQSG